MTRRTPSADDLIAELSQSEERFRTICEHAPVMIDQFDAEGRCTLWNNECEKQIGYGHAEVQACDDPLTLFYPDPGERDRVLDSIQTADGTFREYRVRAKDGSSRIQLWANFRLPDGSLISVGHDVTQQRDTEAKLRQSQKMDALGQLTGGMAHDFNNLLTVVLGNAEMLQKTDLDAKQEARSINEIIGAATRGAALIRKLLAFGRRQVVELVPVDVNALVNELAPTLTRLLPDSIRVTVQTEPSLPHIDGDHGAVEQVLLNLVTNARDAMQDGGLLQLSIEGRWLDADEAHSLQCFPGEYVAIVIRDDGMGMTPTIQRRMFEPFFTTKEGDGTGLGMPMVYGLMKQQRGAVVVNSAQGEGTTVELLFPVMGTPEAPPSARPGFETKTVLVVEDQPAIRRLTASILLHAGYAVEEAPNGVRALERLDKEGHGIDLVLCDLVMPEMGGAELYAAVSKRPDAPPFLFVTGYAGDEELARLGSDETVPILRKPYREQQLLTAITTTLGEELDAREARTS